MRRRSLDRLGVALAVIGLVVAAYLTLLHYDTNVPLACGQGSVIDCNVVLNSPSSVVLDVPVALWGLLWFAVALVLFLLPGRARPGSRPGVLRHAGLVWTLVGTLAVLWLVYQEIGVIGRICIWCTAIHVLVLALLVVEVLAERPEAEG